MRRNQEIIVGPDEKEQRRAARRAPEGSVKEGKSESPDDDLTLKIRKKRPRGRPWPSGVSGNPAGRPRGARNKFTEAVLEGIRRAEAELTQPRVIDRDKPYECWDGYLIQKGLWFAWDPLLQDYVALPQQEPPRPPARFDPTARRTEMTWKGRSIYVQHGWAFDPRTWRRLNF